VTAEHPVVRLTNPASMPPAVGYSHVAEVTGGKTIYIAGQVALDRNGNPVGEGDMRAQAQQVFANLKAALESVGADFDSVVKLNFYILDITQIQAIREVRDQFVNTRHPPVSTAVEIRRFVRDGLLIEIDAVAVIPK
jgi:enamine deaminase RidA (YjgF/YER057c/UK114 family)